MSEITERIRQAAIDSAWKTMRADAQQHLAFVAAILLGAAFAVSVSAWVYLNGNASRLSHAAGAVTITMIALVIIVTIFGALRDSLKPMGVDSAKQLLADAAIEAAVEAGTILAAPPDAQPSEDTAPDAASEAP